MYGDGPNLWVVWGLVSHMENPTRQRSTNCCRFCDAQEATTVDSFRRIVREEAKGVERAMTKPDGVDVREAHLRNESDSGRPGEARSCEARFQFD